MRLGPTDGVIIPDDFDVQVNRLTPEVDECRNLFLHLIKQAVDDYESYRYSTKDEHMEIWNSANEFLFDDNYYINWGEMEINLEQICDFLGIELVWVRKRIKARFGIELHPDGIVNV